MIDKVFIPILSVAIGAFLTYLFNREKVKSEIDKNRAEIDKIRAETDNVRIENKNMKTSVAVVESGQQEQKELIEKIQKFLVKQFLTKHQLEHLKRFAVAEYWPFQQDASTSFFIDELRNLRAIGLIEGYPNKGIRTLFREGGDINAHFKISSEGKEYLELLNKSEEN